MKKLKKYKGLEIIKGVTDLKSKYAFHGTSQGDNSATNNVDVFKAADSWMYSSIHFKDVNLTNQKDVLNRSNEIKLENDTYIKELKDNGEYGKSNGFITVEMIEDPAIDKTTKPRIESYSYDIWDFNKINDEKE